MENLSISTIPVTIRVMEVGGKRLTLSVFKQIPEEWFFDSDISDEQRSNEYLGWVNNNGKNYILFNRNGCLLKEAFDIEPFNWSLFRGYESAKEWLGKYAGEKSLDVLIKEREGIVSKWEKHEHDRLANNKQYEDLLDNKAQIYISI